LVHSMYVSTFSLQHFILLRQLVESMLSSGKEGPHQVCKESPHPVSAELCKEGHHEIMEPT
jgi:hypothetical protein